jgi:cytochrome c biogenesis protein CcmG/thiol:disulfide interchange protein DsbE
MLRRRKLLIAGLAVAALVALGVLGLASVHSSPSGRPAPVLPRELLAGPAVTLAGLSARSPGKPMLIVFWASWCEPCAREAGAIERFARSAAGRGRVVGVDWSDSLAGARSFIRSHAWTFTNLRDAEGTVGSDYRLTGLPTSFVVDGSRHIRAVLRGPQDEASLAGAMRAIGGA